MCRCFMDCTEIREESDKRPAPEVRAGREQWVIPVYFFFLPNLPPNLPSDSPLTGVPSSSES